jgi:hypothetical protein
MSPLFKNCRVQTSDELGLPTKTRHISIYKLTANFGLKMRLNAVRIATLGTGSPAFARLGLTFYKETSLHPANTAH